MRKPFIAGNWKMNNNIRESVALAKALTEKNKNITDRDIMIAPVFTSLSAVAETIKGSAIKLGAQNMHYEKPGAFTGEISADMLTDAGCTYVILGHSERRLLFAETDIVINKKIKCALANKLLPILCCGEVLEEREKGKMNEVVEKQLAGSLDGISEKDAGQIIIAYEPVWAIGTGKTATPEDADNMHKFIREYISRRYSKTLAAAIRILYGGSVKDSNVDSLMSKENIDGALVGGASLNADSFNRIINFKK